MDEDGCLFISDNRRLQVLQFDPEGVYLRNYGREGRGPGEFQSVDILSVIGDTLTIYDIAQGRTTRFRTSGELIDVISVPATMPRGYAPTAVERFHPLSGGPRLAIERSLQRSTHYRFRATILSADLDTLWSADTPLLRTFQRTEAQPGYSARILGIIYGPLPAVVYHPGMGTIISPGDRPELLVYSDKGGLLRRIRVMIEPQPVTAAEQRRYAASLDQRIAEAEGPAVVSLQQEREGLVFAEFKPAWTSMLVDDEGFIWLTVPETRQERSDSGGTLHRVLSAEGRYIGDTRWPTALANARVSRGYLLVVESDAGTDEPLPTVYRIEPVVSGLRYPR